MIEEFYKNINGNYSEALNRMQNDERIKKFLGYFLADTSYSEFVNAMENKDVDSAFRAAHTLKGVCKNMAFTALSIVAEAITEELRAHNFEKAEEIFPNVKKEYDIVITEINKIM